MGCSEAYGRQDRLRSRPEQWLQATFANRYHRFRKVHGKLFARQAALKAPVRPPRQARGRQAHRRPLDSPAKRAAPSTRHALRQGRFKSLIVEEDGYLGALQHYVHLNPVRAGICTVDKLKEYLDWLSADAPAQKEMAFEEMCRGWALGTKSFKRGLLESEGLYVAEERQRNFIREEVGAMESVDRGCAQKSHSRHKRVDRR